MCVSVCVCVCVCVCLLSLFKLTSSRIENKLRECERRVLSETLKSLNVKSKKSRALE